MKTAFGGAIWLFYAHVILLICRQSRPCIIYYFLPSKAMRTLKAIVKKMISKAPKTFILGALVPVTGLEPVRCCHRGILSPLRLPIPPHRRACAPLCRVLCNYNIIAHRCQAFFTLSIRKTCFSLFPVFSYLSEVLLPLIRHKRIEPGRLKSFIFRILGRFSLFCNICQCRVIPWFSAVFTKSSLTICIFISSRRLLQESRTAACCFLIFPPKSWSHNQFDL